jgi:hypothetical protein
MRCTNRMAREPFWVYPMFRRIGIRYDTPFLESPGPRTTVTHVTLEAFFVIGLHAGNRHYMTRRAEHVVCALKGIGSVIDKISAENETVNLHDISWILTILK